MISPKLSLAGTEVPRIGLGTNRLTNTPAHVDLVKTAVAAGVGYIDTAHLYTGGESEATIGAALSPRTGGLRRPVQSHNLGEEVRVTLIDASRSARRIGRLRSKRGEQR